jgi:hypothetical protein
MDASKVPIQVSNGWANSWGWSVTGSEATGFDISYDSAVPASSNTLIYQNAFSNDNQYSGVYYRSLTLSGETLDLATPNVEIAALGFGFSKTRQNGYYMTISTFVDNSVDKYMAIIREPSGGVVTTLSNGGPGFDTTYSPRAIAYNLSGVIFQLVDGTGAVTEEYIADPPQSAPIYAYIHAGNSDILNYTISRYELNNPQTLDYFSASVEVNDQGSGTFCNVITVVPGARDPPGYTLNGYTLRNETENTSIALGTDGLDSNGSNGFFIKTGVFTITTVDYSVTANYTDVLGNTPGLLSNLQATFG